MKKFITAMIMAAATVLVTGVNWKYGYAEDTGSDTPILKLDTGGHMSGVNNIIPMKDGRHVITCSDDKTIRIWDITTGAETSKILGNIGAGREGMIYAMALTRDERYLAVGGFLAHNRRDGSVIRVYDLSTGSIVKVLKSHGDAVLDLSVSPDGRYLVSASGDKTAMAWDIRNDFQLVHVFTGHQSILYRARIFKSGDDYRVVSAGNVNEILLSSLGEKKWLNYYTHGYNLTNLSVSGDFIAASGNSGKTILIFDHKLNIVKRIECEMTPSGLAFSPDGGLLLAGTSPHNYSIYDVKKGFVKIISFTTDESNTMTATFIDNSTVVSADSDNNGIFVWDAITGKVKREIKGAGESVRSVGIKGKEIAFGNTYTGKSERSVNTETCELKNLTGDDDFKKIDPTYGGYSLKQAAGSFYGHEDAVLVISKNNTEVSRITRDATDGYGHLVYGFTGNGTVISGGYTGQLNAYDTDGKEIASFIGHTNDIRSIAVEGDTLISGSSDQTIKVWNLKEIETGKNKDQFSDVKEIYPVVTIFVSKENEWVIWNEQGFYTASPNGDRFVGWHVNHGLENSAEYYSAKQFRRYLYRPDIIKRTLELMSGEKAVAEFIKKEPGLENITVAELVKRAPVDVNIESVDVNEEGYADVKIRLGSNNTTSPERITIYVNGAQALTEKQRVLKKAKPGDLLTYHVRLTDKKNYIKITVENQWAENSAHTTVDVPGGTKVISTKDTTLYVVAVGISRYPELSEVQQLKSPPIDAKSIAANFKKLEGVLYKKVDVIVLTDDDGRTVTSDRVEKALLEQTHKAGPLDTTIIFIAGHGVTDATGSYHFVTADTKIKSASGMQTGIEEGTSFNWKRLHRVLDTTMGRRIVIVDTCQAGEVFSDIKTDISKLVKDVHDVNAIVYSGTSRQDSGIETKEGGVFTLSIISGIKGKAKYDGNILPFMNLRDYVNIEVPARNEKIMKRLIERAIKVEGIDGKNIDSDNTQKPVAVVPEGMDGFVIYGK